MNARSHLGDQRRSYSAAMRELNQAQKPPHGTGAFSRFVNRPLGRRLAAVAFVVGLTPNQVSAVSALMTFSGIGALAIGPGEWWLGIGVSALLLLGYALDSADGQVARLTGLGSPFGEWLDHMIDCAKVSALHLTTAVYLYRSAEIRTVWLLVPLAYCLVENVLFFGMTLTDKLLRTVEGAKKQAPLSLARSLLVLPTDFGVLCLVYGLVGVPALFLGFYSAMFIGYSLLLLAALARWSVQLKALTGRLHVK